MVIKVRCEKPPLVLPHAIRTKMAAQGTDSSVTAKPLTFLCYRLGLAARTGTAEAKRHR